MSLRGVIHIQSDEKRITVSSADKAGFTASYLYFNIYNTRFIKLFFNTNLPGNIFIMLIFIMPIVTIHTYVY